MKLYTHSPCFWGFLAALIGIVCSACAINPPSASTDPEIIFPATGASFDEGVTFSLLGKSLEPGIWRSSIDGNLGEGKSIVCSLSPGLHTITYSVHPHDSRTISITVKAACYTAGAYKSVAIGRTSTKILLAPGLYVPMIASTGSEKITVQSQAAARGKHIRPQAFCLQEHTRASFFHSFQAEAILPEQLVPHKKTVSKDSAASTVSAPHIGDTRTFRVANVTQGTMSDPFVITASLCHIAHNMHIWRDISENINETVGLHQEYE